MKNNRQSTGFILPALVIFSMVLMAVGLVVLQYVSSSTNSVQTAFYGNIAKEAANAGAVMGYSCLHDNNGVAPWTTTLTPNTSCTGAVADATRSIYTSQADDLSWRATFTVGAVTTNASGLSFTSTGTVGFYYAGSSTPTRTFTQTTRVNIPNDLSASTVTPAVGEAVTDLSVGFYNTCALANQKLYCWGGSAVGQLGLGDNTNRSTPTLVNTGGITNKRVDAMSMGALQGCALSEGRAYCWGINTRGQMGNGTAPGFLADTWDVAALLTATRNPPTKVTGALDTVNTTSIAPSWTNTTNGDRTSICAVSNGKVYCWGSNNWASLGQPKYGGLVDALCVANGWVSDTIFGFPSEYLCAKPLNTGITPFDNYDASSPTPVFGFSNRKQEDKSLLYNQRVTDIDAGQYGPCVIANGKVYCWGSSYVDLQLTNDPFGSTNLRSSALKTGGLSGLYATDIASGSDTACAIANGRGYCWGRLRGNGVDSNNTAPLLVSSIPSTVALTSAESSGEISGPLCLNGSGNSYCWGYSQPNTLTPQTISTPDNAAITDVGTGGAMSSSYGLVSGAYGNLCYVANASSYCRGNNSLGQIGDGTTSSTPSATFQKASNIGLTSGQAATAITSGDRHSCALVNGYPYCWGYNASGQLGTNDTANKTHPYGVRNLPDTKTTTSIDAGTNHTCAVANGQAYCWGSNASGQLGTNDTANRTSATLVNIGDMIGKNVTAISAGRDHTCAVANGQAYCWGSNTYGQLGRGNTTSSLSPVAVSTSGALSGKAVTAISVGDRFTCAIADGQPYCWGERANGKIGNGGVTTGNTTSPVLVSNMTGTSTDIQTGPDYACALEAGIPKCWGRNNTYQLGLGNITDQTTPQTISGMGARNTTSLSLGTSHACSVSNGYLFCWGSRANGRIGNSGTTTGSTTTPVQLPENTGAGLIGGNNPRLVSAGGSGSCAIANAKIFCWGAGSLNQIGNDGVADAIQPTQTGSYTRDITVISWSDTIFY